MTPPAARDFDRPITPTRVNMKLEEGERLYAQLLVDVKGLATAQREDAQEMRKVMREHEKINTAREAALREEIAEVRADVRGVSAQVAGLRSDIDARFDKLERAIAYSAGAQGGAPPTPPHGVPMIQSKRAAGAVGAGGITASVVLGYVSQISGLPLPLQWALALVAVMVAATACVIAARGFK